MLRISTKHTYPEALAPPTTHTEEHKTGPHGYTLRHTGDNAGCFLCYPSNRIEYYFQPQPYPCKHNALDPQKHQHKSKKKKQNYSTPTIEGSEIVATKKPESGGTTGTPSPSQHATHRTTNTNIPYQAITTNQNTPPHAHGTADEDI